MNRKIQVKINTETSEVYNLENGTLQGSVISPILFNLMVNDLHTELIKQTNISQFADNSAYWYADKNVKRLQKRLQDNMDKITKWSSKWGFKISQLKTVRIIFKTKYMKQVKLNINFMGKPINFVEYTKFLGMILDQHMTWKQHILDLIGRIK